MLERAGGGTPPLYGAYVQMGVDQTQNFQPAATLNWQGLLRYDTNKIFDTVGKQNFVIPGGFKYAKAGAQVDTGKPGNLWSVAYPGPAALNEITYPTAGSLLAYQCTVAGNTGAVEPVWPLTIGATVVDGGVTWTAIDPGGVKARIQWSADGGGFGRGTEGQKMNNFKTAHVVCNPNTGWLNVSPGDTFSILFLNDIGVVTTVVSAFSFFWIELRRR